MAKVTRTVTELTDDIDGGDADETVSFALDGTAYEIDLNAANAAGLRDAFATFIGHARRGSKPAARRAVTGKRASASSGNVSEIRSWAKDNGYAVSERGRISSEVLTAYEGAH